MPRSRRGIDTTKKSPRGHPDVSITDARIRRCDSIARELADVFSDRDPTEAVIVLRRAAQRIEDQVVRHAINHDRPRAPREGSNREPHRYKAHVDPRALD